MEGREQVDFPIYASQKILEKFLRGGIYDDFVLGPPFFFMARYPSHVGRGVPCMLQVIDYG